MTSLDARLRVLIAAEGPLTVAQYMQMALSAYYGGRDPLGAAGDFVTAPEISQIFGELVGLWLVQVWEDAGRPAKLRLVELGPGRGTLMADLWRAARVRPGFHAAASVHLVETSPALRAKQQAALADVPVVWHAALGEVPADAPLFLVANEFFDALPVRQFVFAEGGWRERCVGLDAAGGLAFRLSPAPTALVVTPHRPAPRDSDVIEICPAAENIVRDIAARIAARGGAALIADYGHDGRGYGDTLQALREHAFADPLQYPGAADLTAHVDFAALAVAARQEGAEAMGPIDQGAWLSALGIAARAEALSRARPDQAGEIAVAVRRLTAPEAMGRLFKVMAIAQSGSAPMLGFAP